MMFIEESPIEQTIKPQTKPYKTNGVPKELPPVGGQQRQQLQANGHKSIVDRQIIEEVRQVEAEAEKQEDSEKIEITLTNNIKNLIEKAESILIVVEDQVEQEISKSAEALAVVSKAEGEPSKAATIPCGLKVPLAEESTVLPDSAEIKNLETVTVNHEQQEPSANVGVEVEVATTAESADHSDQLDSEDQYSYVEIVDDVSDVVVRENELLIKIEDADEDSSDEETAQPTPAESPIKETYLHSRRNTSSSIHSRAPAELPPLPDAIPIETCFQLRSNQKLPTPPPPPPVFEKRPSQSNRDLPRWSDLEAESGFDAIQSQMGFEIFKLIKDYLNIGTDSADKAGEREDRTRKRRFEDCSQPLQPPNVIKYRKVDNHFPKFITHTLEDDMNPQTGRSVYQPPYNLQLQNSLESAQSSRAMFANDKDKQQRQQRKSLFMMPMRTQNIVRNTTYADIEFSDDDEEVIVRDNAFKAGLSLSNHQQQQQQSVNVPGGSRIVNIPIQRSTKMAARASLANNQKNNQNLTTVGGFNLFPKPRLGEPMKRTRPSITSAIDSECYVLGERPLNSFISRAMSSSKMHNKNNSIWSTNAMSILQQEKEIEEREKYKQLLQKVAPCIYSRDKSLQSSPRSSSFTNKGLPAQRQRQREKPGVNNLLRRSLHSSSAQQSSKESSVINLADQNGDDDDGSDELAITGMYSLPTKAGNRRSLEPIANKQQQKQPSPSAISLDDSSDEDDDDEVSEIVDVDNLISASGVASLKENIGIFDTKEKKAKKKTSKLPFVAPINSLEECLSASPHSKANWLEKFHHKWNEKKEQRQRQLQETALEVDKISAERLEAEQRLQERLREFHIVEPDIVVIDDFADVEEEPEIIPLTKEQQDRIKAAICGSPDQVLVSKFNMNITRRDIQTLLGNNWLNDEVINFYMNLLMERGEKKHESQGYPTVYAQNTFFIPRLMQGGHGAVKRWTRKVDIFSKDVMPVPVHVGGVHWCMAIVHMKNKTIKYYDSMGTPNPGVLAALERYLQDESLDKRKQPFDTSGFEIESVRDVPRQMNGSDCGVFSCMFAEYITRNREITFTQAEMEYFRHKMILEIVQGELLR